MNIHIYYRHSNINTISNERPDWFSYEKCFKQLLNTINKHPNVHLTIAMDGNIENNFIEKYVDTYELFKTNFQNSLLSYRSLLNFIKDCKHQSNDLIYFLENDYMHVDNWVEKIIELYSTYSGLDYVSLYDHNDKYFLEMYDTLVSKIFTTNSHHWRTTPSTCGSFIITRKIFDEDYDIWSTAVGDHEMFLYLNKNRNRFVYTPIPGLSTHCMNNLLSPCINWENI
jgi:hypothetical protein